jgi:hypothetical protein
MNKGIIMKKLLIGLTLLASMSSFAKDVCVMESTDTYVSVRCSSEKDNYKSEHIVMDKTHAMAKAMLIKKLLEDGYTAVSDSMLIRD